MTAATPSIETGGTTGVRRGAVRVAGGSAHGRHWRRPGWLTVVAGVILLGGCGQGGGAASTALPAVSPSGSVASGCGHAASAGSVTVSLESGGHQRIAVVHVPTGYTGSTPVPLVLNLHGSGATAADQEGFSGMDGVADADGFMVVYPQGLIPEGSGFDWNVPGEPLVGGGSVPPGSADDVAFLGDLVRALEASYCIDPNRVYATGFSGGGRMASQLGCDASGVFAAVAPVSGLRHPTPCPATRAVPVIAFHGTADPVDPYGGSGQAYWTYSVPQAAADWATQDGCAIAAPTAPGSGYTLTEYAGCSDGAGVELYSLTGEGHEWPGGPHMPSSLTRELGPQSSAVDADSLMWSFFAAHPLP
jgi:polyhydroxybutyrate depolymerase